MNTPAPSTQLDSVDLIASCYEWICPACGELNHEIEATGEVACSHCQSEYEANPPEHAQG